jgi:FkbM family methyltransferase
MAELKSEREAAKAAKAEKAAMRRALMAQERAVLAEKVRQRALGEDYHSKTAARQLEALALDFCTCNEKSRKHFLNLVSDYIPLLAHLELTAAIPPQRLDYERSDIYLRVQTRSEHARLRACAKEPFTIAWLHERVGAAGVLYDIGANVGAYSLVAALKPGSTVRVVAFEPSYGTVASLCENIVINRVDDRVTPLPVALSDCTGLKVFALRDRQPGAARHVLADGQAGDASDAAFQQPVMTLRLDDAVRMFDLPAPNHIKLDVDGGELAVLQGGVDTLSSPALQTMLVEVATSLSEAVIAALAQCGLRLESKHAVLNKSGEYGVWYGLFVR